MALTLADLFATPDHYLHSFDGGNAVFVPMDGAAYRRSIFLDARISPAAEGSMVVPVAMLDSGPEQGMRTGWIFHVAHCGSTLLARALEELGGNLVLKEPAALRQLGFEPDPQRLDLTLGMLARRYDPAAMTVVKTNVPVNFILGELAERRPCDVAITLYWKLEDYLIAILRSENHRQWLRGITGSFAERLGLRDVASDAERAAALWLVQVNSFLALFEAMPAARSLDAGQLFSDPARTIRHAAHLFGMAAGEDVVKVVAHGKLFSTYSKRPDVTFANADRLARAATVANEIGEEIAQARAVISARGQSADALEHALAEKTLGT